MKITEKEFADANQRAATKKAAFPAIEWIKYDRRVSRVVIRLASGLELGFSPHEIQGLERAHPAELADIEISPSGLGMHFPKLDADVYLPALLEGFLGSKRWMAAQNGRAGGSSSSAAKAQAARNNGKLGGRPRKLLTPAAA